MADGLQRMMEHFNPRPRAGSDLWRAFRSFAPNHFNPRPRAGSDGYTQPIVTIYDEFQSTPPSGERPEPDYWNFLKENISIHAPERGATQIGQGLRTG